MISYVFCLILGIAASAQESSARLNYKKPSLTPLNYTKRHHMGPTGRAKNRKVKPKIVAVSFNGSEGDFTEEDLEPLKKKLRETNRELRRKKTTSERKYAHKNRNKKSKKEAIRVQADVEVVGPAEDGLTDHEQTQRKVASTRSQNKKKPSFSTLYQQFQRHYEVEVERDPDIECDPNAEP